MVPNRIFLDTNTINFILDFGEEIFDLVSPKHNLTKYIIRDILAFQFIFQVFDRTSWQIAISPLSYSEILNTKDPSQRRYLDSWFLDVWDYWKTVIEEDNDLPSYIDAENNRINILNSGFLEILHDIDDRLLIIDSINYNCDVFCTRDYNSILKYRDKLEELPIDFISPHEWYLSIKDLSY